VIQEEGSLVLTVNKSASDPTELAINSTLEQNLAATGICLLEYNLKVRLDPCNRKAAKLVFAMTLNLVFDKLHIRNFHFEWLSVECVASRPLLQLRAHLKLSNES
jgi:hypothetical protein